MWPYKPNRRQDWRPTYGPWRLFHNPSPFIESLLASRGEDQDALERQISWILFSVRVKRKLQHFVSTYRDLRRVLHGRWARASVFRKAYSGPVGGAECTPSRMPTRAKTLDDEGSVM